MKLLFGQWLGVVLVSLFSFTRNVALSNKGYEAQLYEDLLYDYNKIPRPVRNSSDVLLVDVGASLIRIIDVDEKNQVLTTNVWLEMRWTDIKLQWRPEKYGGIRALHVPIAYIWSPDIVLYNNAAGDPDITIFTDAHVSYDGRVFWQPPAIYKSFCSIDVTWFPYDIQNCNMKFGAWSYTGFYVDLRQLPHEKVIMQKDADNSDVEFMQDGMDLSFFYKSAEWDLLSLTSARHSVLYASCCGPEKYVDITYYFVLRRKTLFFTSNLMVPCFLISFLTTFVFCLSDHKITFSISILITLTVFFLVLIDLMPPTSLVIPMFGRYLTTTLILVSLSTLISVISVNFRYRSGAAYQMSPWIRQIFIKCLPKLLLMKNPEKQSKPMLKKDPTFSTTKLFMQSCASLSSLSPAITKAYSFVTPLNNVTESSLKTQTDLFSFQQQRENTRYYESLSRSYLEPTTKSGSLKQSQHQRHVSVSFDDENNNDHVKSDIEDKKSNECRERNLSMKVLDSSVTASKTQSSQKMRFETSTEFQYPTPCRSSQTQNNLWNSLIVEEQQLGNDSSSLCSSLCDKQLKYNDASADVSNETTSRGESKSLHSLEKLIRPMLTATEAEKKKKMKSNQKNFESQSSIEAVRIVKQKVNDVIFANLLRQVRFIAEHFRRTEEESEVSDDWTFVAMVLDRLFLIIFGILNIATFSILLEAPSLYDSREPLNITSAHSTASKPLGVINLSFCSKMQNST